MIVGFWVLATMATLGPMAALTVIAHSMVLYGTTVAIGLWAGPWSAAKRA